MSIGQSDPQLARVAFWATGASVYMFWNLATLIGAVGAAHLGSAQSLGLDAAEPAAFLALLAPRLTDLPTAALAVAGAAVTLAATPLTKVGVPILLAALVAVAAGWRRPSS